MIPTQAMMARRLRSYISHKVSPPFLFCFFALSFEPGSGGRFVFLHGMNEGLLSIFHNMFTTRDVRDSAFLLRARWFQTVRAICHSQSFVTVVSGFT